jgi:two-component system cell cycle sensor histidine kinase/response regulator CckA
MANASDIPWPEEPRRVFEEARLELARLSVEGHEASLRDVARRVTELAAHTLSVERVGIWVLNDDRTALRCYDLFERSKGEHSEGAVLCIQDFPIYFQALETRREIPADLAPTDPLTQELGEAYLAPLGIVSMLDAPIYHDGRVKGVVCHEQIGTPRRWASEERDFATAVADACALKLESALRQRAEAALQAQQAALVEHQKMEALGRLAGGIAHDFKNLLNGILGHAHLIRGTAGLPPQVREDATTICQVAQRGVELVRELFDFGGTCRCATSIVNVTAVLGRMTDVLRATVGPQHTVTVHYADGVGRVLIDPAQFERVVLNLVVNARDALPEGGPIDVRLSSQSADVVLEVRDGGMGMDAATQARMFEPFFTTKPGKGTGLGLAVVKQIVDRCGGRIDVASEPGNGTRVRVHLPRASASLAAQT